MSDDFFMQYKKKNSIDLYVSLVMTVLNSLSVDHEEEGILLAKAILMTMNGDIIPLSVLLCPIPPHWRNIEENIAVPVSLAAGGVHDPKNTSVKLIQTIMDCVPEQSMNSDLRQLFGKLGGIFLNARKHCNVRNPNERCADWTTTEGYQKATLVNLFTLASTQLGGKCWIASWGGTSTGTEKMFGRLCEELFLFFLPYNTHISNLSVFRPGFKNCDRQCKRITKLVKKFNDSFVTGYGQNGFPMDKDIVVDRLMSEPTVIFVGVYGENIQKHKEMQRRSMMLVNEKQYGKQYYFQGNEINIVHILCGGVKIIGEPRWNARKTGDYLCCSSCNATSTPIYNFVAEADYNPEMTTTHKADHEMISITSTICATEKKYLKRYFEDPMHTNYIMCTCSDKGEGKRKYNRNHAKIHFVLTSDYAGWVTEKKKLDETNVVIQCNYCECKLTQRTMPLDEWLMRTDPDNTAKSGRLMCGTTKGGCGKMSSKTTEQWQII